MATQDRETAVRDYLTALKEPAGLRDEQAIKRLESKLDKATDPVERLELRQRLLDAQRVDTSELEAAFVKHAKAWADKHGVTGQALRDEGVPPKVLRAAGFTVRGAARGAKKTTKRRAPRVSAEQIRNKIKAKRAEFTVADIANDTGAAVATARKVIGDMLQAGELQEAGERQEGRGRAAKTYQKA